MAITREAAWEHLCEWTKTDALRIHARSVEEVMRAAAHHYGDGDVDVEPWGLAGLMHDADYEAWPDDHPKRIVAWLEQRGEDSVAHAISAHYTQWGVSYDTQLDRALLACDELTGFICACALVRPEGIATLGPKSVKKKLKSKGFASGVDRAEVAAGVQMLEVELGDHIQFIIAALQPFAEEFGIAGSGGA